MQFRPETSRRRFLEYQRRVAKRRAEQAAAKGLAADAQTAATRQNRSFLTLLWQFLKLLGGNGTSIAIALSTLTFATLLKLIPPAGTKVVIDYVLSDNPLPRQAADWLGRFSDPASLLVLLALVTVGVSLSASVLHVWGRWYATLASKRVQISVRRRVFGHAVRLPLDRVYQLKSGGVASLLREDAGGIAELIFSLLYNPWSAIIQLIGSMAILAWVDWRLLLGSLVLIPAVFLTHRTWISRIRPLYKDIKSQRQDVDSHATEAFGGMRVVRAFGRGRSETGRFTRSNHLMARQELRVWWWARGIELAWEFLIPAASAALLWYGGSQVLNGNLSLGDLMMFLFYLAMLLEPLAVLANSATQFQNNLAGLDRVLDLLEENAEMPDTAGSIAIDPADVDGSIRLRNVSFHYPGSAAPVLSDINLEVAAGEMIALVGTSGAGKTTLCNLVARFYDPTSGAVELDGIDLRSITVDSYRGLLGIVEQDIFLFDGTIAENIGYADRNATLSDVRRAATMAHADEFIMSFEKGYDTIIGERGVRLSGGQRQRLAIARAILADPKILILDEATSSLDTESERLIQQSLEQLMQGRTSFVIAHRLSTITHADRIVLLEDGQIRETGTHEELMAASGRYRQMVQIQLSGFDPEAISAEQSV